MVDPRSAIGVVIAEGQRLASERMLELCTRARISNCSGW